MANNLNGLILSGGQSKRAGTDKGLKALNGKTWVEIMREKLQYLGLDVNVSINLSQFEAYKNAIAKESLIIDDISIPGPLRGILTAHVHFPENNWLVLACDQIDMKSETIKKLIDGFDKSRDFDFYVYKNAKRYQPFCGIYTSIGLKKLLNAYRKKHDENYSMQHVFDNFNTFSIAVEEKNQSFNNYNK